MTAHHRHRPARVLTREVEAAVERPRYVLGRTALAAGAILAIIAAVGELHDYTTRTFGESKSDVARHLASRLAHGAYAQWRLQHPGVACPAAMVELSRHGERRPAVDPWGQPYQMVCGELGGIAVWSAGEDRIGGTHDDIWSTP